MEGDFLTRVKLTYDHLTKTEKKVADYILQDPKRILFMSITELAEACEVGDTSVFRFCKSMELTGYQEFKMKLSLSLRSDVENRLELDSEISLDDGFPDLAKKVLKINMNALTETFALLDEQKFLQAIDYLHEADRIYFFGVGASLLTAMKAMNRFLRIEPKVYCVQDSHMQAMAASMLTPRDVAVFFSYSGATKDTLHVAEEAKKAGARILCLTRFAKSPLTSYSDVTLLCGSNEGPLQGGSTSAEISFLFLIDLMYTEYYRRYYDQCSENNQKTSGAVVEKLC